MSTISVNELDIQHASEFDISALLNSASFMRCPMCFSALYSESGRGTSMCSSCFFGEKTAFDYLKYLRRETYTVPRQPSNSEIRRWLENGSVKINGKYPKPNDLVEFPINELVYFPESKFRTTIV